MIHELMPVRLDSAKTCFLRIWCDHYFPYICDLALGGNQSAVQLLVFSARNELQTQTPPPTDNRLKDYWDAMRLLEERIEANPGTGETKG